MKIESLDDAIDTWKAHDEWQYADREAAWKWMYECGRTAEREACAALVETDQVGKVATFYDWTKTVGADLASKIRARF